MRRTQEGSNSENQARIQQARPTRGQTTSKTHEGAETSERRYETTHRQRQKEQETQETQVTKEKNYKKKED